MTMTNRRVAARCALCGKPLLDPHLVDHWGTKFCREHQGKYPLCRFCGRLVLPRARRRSSGSEAICPICRANAIDRLASARPIFDRLVRWVNGQGLIFNDLNLRIELRNRKQLAEFLRQSGDTKCLGATLHTTYTENGRVTRTEVNGVAILRGLPSVLFQEVTVHELGHAWLAVHYVVDLPRQSEEGFCELLAYRYLTQTATKESLYHAKAIERNPDTIYGEGFRRIRPIAEAGSFHRLLDTLRLTKQLR
jgi:hypothetical protein